METIYSIEKPPECCYQIHPVYPYVKVSATGLTLEEVIEYMNRFSELREQVERELEPLTRADEITIDDRTLMIRPVPRFGVVFTLRDRNGKEEFFSSIEMFMTHIYTTGDRKLLEKLDDIFTVLSKRYRKLIEKSREIEEKIRAGDNDVIDIKIFEDV